MVVQAASHLKELTDRDVVSIGNALDIFETGSSKRSFPSWASSTIMAAVIVLVFEAILECVSARGGVMPPQLRRAIAESEIALWRAQQNHGPRQQKLLGCRLHDALKHDRVERLEICCCVRRHADGARYRNHNSQYSRSPEQGANSNPHALDETETGSAGLAVLSDIR